MDKSELLKGFNNHLIEMINDLIPIVKNCLN